MAEAEILGDILNVVRNFLGLVLGVVLNACNSVLGVVLGVALVFFGVLVFGVFRNVPAGFAILSVVRNVLADCGSDAVGDECWNLRFAGMFAEMREKWHSPTHNFAVRKENRIVCAHLCANPQPHDGSCLLIGV